MNIWVERKIGDLLSSTFTGEWGDEQTAERAVPVLTSSNFNDDGTIDFSKINLRSINERVLASKRICKNDILLEKSGGSTNRPAGRVVFCERNLEGTCSNFVEVLRIKAEYNAKFVFYLLYFYYMSGKVQKYQQQTTGIINFKFNEYKNEEISIPTLRYEQNQIAKILRKTEAAIKLSEHLISKYKQIKTGLMHDLLKKGIDENGNIRSEKSHKFKDSIVGRIPEEWEIMCLSECSSVIISNVDKKFNSSETPVLLCNYMDVYSNEEISDTVPFMHASATRDEILKYKVKKGDVIITKDSETPDDIAIPAYVQTDVKKLVCGYHLALIRPKSSVLLGEFLNKLLQMSFYKKYFGTLATGSTRFGLSTGAIKNAAIVLPSMVEQQRIIGVLAAQENLIEDQKLLLTKYQRLKNGLMQDVLSGKVRIKEDFTIE